MKKLAIITTHPIQYHAPLFKLLSVSQKLDVKVYYTWGKSVLDNKYDPGFGKKVEWDIPLLEGYEYSFVNNVSKDPGSHHYRGIINPGLHMQIEEWGADAALVFGWSFVSHLKCIRYFHNRIPVYFRGDSTLLRQQSGIKNVLRKFFLSWVYRHVDKAFYVGTANKDYFTAYGLKAAQLIFAPHAVDNQRFEDIAGSKEKAAKVWKSALGIKESDLVIVYAGKLEPVKNLGYIIELAKRTRDLPIQFLIVGNGPQEQELKEQAKELKNIVFIDFQNQSTMPLVYRLGHLFILPSQSETWGLAINEAMASGRGVLVSKNVACAADLIEVGKNGFEFDTNSYDELVGWLQKLSADPEKRDAMGIESKKIIANWCFEKTAGAIENEILKNKKN